MSGRDAMRFTTLVPALEEQLGQARPDGLVGLGSVAELQEQLARIYQIAVSLNQPERIERIKVLQQRLTDIEAQATLRYGADAHDPSLEMVVHMRVPSQSSSPTPSRAAVAGALALTVCTAGLAAPWYISLRRKRAASKASSAQLPEEPGPSPAPAPSPAPVQEAEPSIECPICFDTVPQSRSCGLLNCSHRFCRYCFVECFSVMIRDGHVGEDKLVCPDPSCKVAAQAYELESLLPEDIFTKYSDFLVLRGLQNDANTCWCPNLQCGEAIVAAQGQDSISCPACGQSFCKACKISPWHAGQTCEEAKKAAENTPAEDGLVIWMREQGTKVKLCPGCKEAIEKNDGCNHMTCSRCSHQFCWLCGQSFESSHFSSGPCNGMQFATGDSLEEALSLRTAPTNILPIDIDALLDIQCGMRTPDDFSISPYISSDSEPELEPITIACGMRPPNIADLIDLVPRRCSMLPPEIASPERVPSPTPVAPFPQDLLIGPPRRCSMLPPDIAPPVRIPSPTPVSPLLQDLLIEPPRRCSMLPPKSKHIKKPAPIRRCSMLPPKLRNSPALPSVSSPSPSPSPLLSPSSSSSSSPRPWSIAERQRIFDTCKMMLEMLETIEDSFSAAFHSRSFLHAAWRRFALWIRLLHGHQDVAERLLPPLDVAFIWHAYMIRTEIYLQDLPALLNGADPAGLGVNIPWKCASSASSEADRQFSVQTWNNGVVESAYDGWTSAVVGDGQPASGELELPYQLRMSFLLEDLNWIVDLRKGWPRFTSNRCDFLNETMEAYFAWLHTTYSAAALTSLKGPPVDIDAFWHSHMLNPRAYRADVESRYGLGRAIWHRPLADGVHDPATI